MKTWTFQLLYVLWCHIEWSLQIVWVLLVAITDGWLDFTPVPLSASFIIHYQSNYNFIEDDNIIIGTRLEARETSRTFSFYISCYVVLRLGRITYKRSEIFKEGQIKEEAVYSNFLEFFLDNRLNWREPNSHLRSIFSWVYLVSDCLTQQSTCSLSLKWLCFGKPC